jgi:hypothetical protein
MGLAKFAESYELLIVGRFMIGVNCGRFNIASLRQIYMNSILFIFLASCTPPYFLHSIVQSSQCKFLHFNPFQSLKTNCFYSSQTKNNFLFSKTIGHQHTNQFHSIPIAAERQHLNISRKVASSCISSAAYVNQGHESIQGRKRPVGFLAHMQRYLGF